MADGKFKKKNFNRGVTVTPGLEAGLMYNRRVCRYEAQKLELNVDRTLTTVMVYWVEKKQNHNHNAI